MPKITAASARRARARASTKPYTKPSSATLPFAPDAKRPDLKPAQHKKLLRKKAFLESIGESAAAAAVDVGQRGGKGKAAMGEEGAGLTPSWGDVRLLLDSISSASPSGQGGKVRTSWFHEWLAGCKQACNVDGMLLPSLHTLTTHSSFLFFVFHDHQATKSSTSGGFQKIRSNNAKKMVASKEVSEPVNLLSVCVSLSFVQWHVYTYAAASILCLSRWSASRPSRPTPSSRPVRTPPFASTSGTSWANKKKNNNNSRKRGM